MKAFIIHTQNEDSLELADRCKRSFIPYNNWDAELFEGTSPLTLEHWEEQYPLKMRYYSRVRGFYEKRDDSPKDKRRYLSKKSCTYSHYRLWKKCVELDEPIVILEHDSVCKSEWDNNIKFDDVLVLNIISAINRPMMMGTAWRRANPNLEIQEGIHDQHIKLMYDQDPNVTDAEMMPGAAAYAISPQGAKKMVTTLEADGWEQNDYIMNTSVVRIQTINPEMFRLRYTNISTTNTGVK